ncbi:MAG: hypothetical protein RLY97_1906 [Pseudomonadota bacterium]|jgi:hypothetical protein
MKIKSFFRRKPVFSRSAVRYSCQVDCDIDLTESEAHYQGRLIDISAGGAMVRPRLAYLLQRRDVPVMVQIRGEIIPAMIMATTPAGFGLRFNQLLSDAQMAQILGAQYLAQAA